MTDTARTPGIFCRLRRLHSQNPGVRMRARQDLGNQHAGPDDVIGVLGLAPDFWRSVHPRDPFPIRDRSSAGGPACARHWSYLLSLHPEQPRRRQHRFRSGKYFRPILEAPLPVSDPGSGRGSPSTPSRIPAYRSRIAVRRFERTRPERGAVFRERRGFLPFRSGGPELRRPVPNKNKRFGRP